jgi:hypothetical protein
MNQLHGTQQIPQRKSHTVSAPPSLRPPAATLVRSPSATRLSACAAATTTLAPPPASGFPAMANRRGAGWPSSESWGFTEVPRRGGGERSRRRLGDVETRRGSGRGRRFEFGGLQVKRAAQRDQIAKGPRVHATHAHGLMPRAAEGPGAYGQWQPLGPTPRPNGFIEATCEGSQGPGDSRTRVPPSPSDRWSRSNYLIQNLWP